jgi:rod shape-determining protein MreD
MKESSHWFVIPITFLVAIILTLLPMPEWTVWLRPAWVLMVLIYWAMVLPYRVNIGTAWVIGIFLDVLNGTLLGEHAFALTVVMYFVVRSYSQLRMFPLLQQGLCIFLFVLAYQFIIFCLQGFMGELPQTLLYWLPSISSMLLWPWVYTLMRDCQHRFKVA